MLAFVASLAFMALEMVAGRLVHEAPGLEHLRLDQRHRRPARRPELRQLPGGKIADFVKNEKQASWLFLAASVLTLTILVLETQPQVVRRTSSFDGGKPRSVLSQAISLLEAAVGAVHHLADLAVPDPVRRHARLLPPRAVAGDRQPGRRQAGGRPAETLQTDRDRDRPGLRLGDGRQHPRHLPDRVSS